MAEAPGWGALRQGQEEAGCALKAETPPPRLAVDQTQGIKDNPLVWAGTARWAVMPVPETGKARAPSLG